LDKSDMEEKNPVNPDLVSKAVPDFLESAPNTY